MSALSPISTVQVVDTLLQNDPGWSMGRSAQPGGTDASIAPMAVLQRSTGPGLQVTTPAGDHAILSPISLELLGSEEAHGA